MPVSPILADVSVLMMGLRLIVSLGIVLGMIAVLAWVARRQRSFGFGGGARRDAITVRGRQQLGKTSTVALLQVGDRTILVGANEHSIQVLAEGDELLPPEPDPTADAPLTPDDRTSSYAGPDGPVSPWTNMIEVLREWSVRRT